MNEHERCREALPFLSAGTLDPGRKSSLEGHLAACADCRREKAFWDEIAAAVGGTAPEPAAPDAPLERALAAIEDAGARPKASRLRAAADLVRWQAALVGREFWPAVAFAAAMAFAAALLTGMPGVLRFFLPLVATASLAIVVDPKNDPAAEIVRSSPTPPGRIILARATLVFGYNLALAAAAGLSLGAALGRGTFRVVIVDELGAMTFMSALALVLSLSWGTANATAVSFGLWFLRFLPAAAVRWLAEAVSLPPLKGAYDVYSSFWRRPGLLLPLAALLVLAALRRAGRDLGRERFAPRGI